MADIIRRPFLNHLRADATSYIRHTSGGRTRHVGAGLAFWFRPTTAALSEVPLDDREQALLFHARTADFQDVTVQATVNFRVADPDRATERIDFGIDPATGTWNATPLETLGGLLTELVQQPALEVVAAMPMAEALARGLAPVQEGVTAALADDPRLAERGLAVTDVRVVAIRADADLERALQTETRERVQQDADRATYERRAMAVERERAIAENELHNQIELARRQEELVTQEGRNERRRAEEEAEAKQIRAAAVAAERRTFAEVKAETIRAVGQAEADADAAKLAAYTDLEQATLLALALKDLAANLPAINNLTLTPDLLTTAVSRFAATGTAGAVGATGVAGADGVEVGDGGGRQ